jgi:nucleoside-diphosphate-sugar epimerase
MRYLVTGGAGFLGSALVRRLLSDGHEVIVLDDFSRGHSERLHGLSCMTLHGDVRDPAAVTDAMHGCDSVLHLAYLQGTQTFYSEPRQVLDVAVRGISNILAACETHGVRELLLVSSSEAYEMPDKLPTPETTRLCVPDPLNPRYSYGGGKLVSELMAVAWERTGVLDRVMIVRPHNIIGPDMGTGHVVPEFALRMSDLVRKHPEGIVPFPIQGTGAETRSFCWIGDFIDQMMLVLKRSQPGTEIYHLGQMDERTVAQVAHAVGSCYEREVKVLPGKLPKGSPTRRLPDTTKVRALGPLPKPLTFEEAVSRTVAWYQLHGAVRR